MSFFKDFKSDINQAMNELMPDGNEVFEEEVPKTKKKKSMNPLSKNRNANKNTIPDLDMPDLDDIAPEDMLDQIDDLLDNELYNDGNNSDLLLDDDLEVNTMDMSVDDLLSQLSEKQGPKSAPDETEVSDDSLDSLLNSITDGDYDGSTIEPQEPEEERETVINDELNSSVLDEIMADENEEMLADEITPDNDEVVSENNTDDIEEDNITDDISNKYDSDDTQEMMDSGDNNPDNISDTDEVADDIDSANIYADSVPDEANMISDEQSENSMDVNEPIEDTIRDDDQGEEKIVPQDFNNDNSEEQVDEDSDVNDETAEYAADDIKEEKSVADKDVISINQNDDKSKETSDKKKSDKPFNLEGADEETTYITKGTNIKGDIETDSSIDVIGIVEGNITSKGKVVVGGTVTGNITAAELYANGARIEGDVTSLGSVKVGVGSMIIGCIEGESAVIAGAVNGEIDVKGPVIVDSTAVIMGNIKSRSVQINNGAVIEGFCSQSYSDIDVKSFFA